MKRLEAQKVHWPAWDWYYCERDTGNYIVFSSKKDFLKKYSSDLLAILDRGEIYKSPEHPKNQLTLDLNK